MLLKVELTMFTDSLDEGYERKRSNGGLPSFGVE